MAYQSRRTPIGTRRSQVTLQERSSSSDGMGGQVVTWADVAQPWARVIPLDGRDQEHLAGDQMTVSHNYHFDLRYRTDVLPSPLMRVVWRTRTFEIRTVVDDDAMRKRIILQCAEVQDANAAT